MNPTATRDLLTGWARELGFDAVGVAGVEASAHGDAYLRWLDEGFHAGMEYLRRRVEARLDPSRILEGVRSVLCVAMRYAPHPDPERAADPARPGPDDLWPRVARYAHGEDYHRVMERRLRSLAERIQAHFPGVQGRSYVDTGPVLERELAARAGIGVPGKNTCLLHREMGSWFLLGELFLTLELPTSDPLTDLCGGCTLCLEACPTDALTEPYRLDASRCISFWTIEHRGPLPETAREMVDDWVFGCDICQEVCPWNRRRLAPVDHPELRLPPERAALDLAGLLRIGREEYVETFRHSPMKRAKQSGLQRNAAVAMGNRGTVDYVAPLATALDDDPDPVVRSHAAWALGRIAAPAAREALLRAGSRETDADVRREIRAALGPGERAADPTP